MKRIGKFTAGSLVGVALIVGFGGVATAASSTTTTGATATTSPTTSTPAKSAPKKPDVPSATQIWETVNATHRIDSRARGEGVEENLEGGRRRRQAPDPLAEIVGRRPGQHP